MGICQGYNAICCRAEREEEERHARALQAQIERAAEFAEDGNEAEEAANNTGVLQRQVGCAVSASSV